MGKHRPQFWVSDLYSAQQGHGEQWQICLAHQLRDCEYSIQEGDVFFAWKLKLLFLKAIAIHRRRERPVVQNNRLKFKEVLDKRLQEILTFEPETPSGRKLKKRYLKHGAHLFTFLIDLQTIPPTNNSSERAIRMSTIYRRVTGGFRSDWGKHFFAAVRSVVNTGLRQQLTPRQSIERALGPEPNFLFS
jgi:transposase